MSLQGFMSTRYRAYRRDLQHAVLDEGWSLYWELILYERGFHETPEKRVGACSSGACTAARASSSR